MPAYFRSHHPESRHWFSTFTAPLLGGVAMLSVVAPPIGSVVVEPAWWRWSVLARLLVSDMSVAAGPESDSPVLKSTPWIVGLIAVAGLGYAPYLERRSPEGYALLGRTVPEETKER